MGLFSRRAQSEPEQQYVNPKPITGVAPVPTPANETGKPRLMVERGGRQVPLLYREEEIIHVSRPELSNDNEVLRAEMMRDNTPSKPEPKMSMRYFKHPELDATYSDFHERYKDVIAGLKESLGEAETANEFAAELDNWAKSYQKDTEFLVEQVEEIGKTMDLSADSADSFTHHEARDVASRENKIATNEIARAAIEVLDRQAAERAFENERASKPGYIPLPNEEGVRDFSHDYKVVEKLTELATRRKTIEDLIDRGLHNAVAKNLGEGKDGKTSALHAALGDSIRPLVNLDSGLVNTDERPVGYTTMYATDYGSTTVGFESSILASYSEALTGKPMFNETDKKIAQMYMDEDYSALNDLLIEEVQSIDNENYASEHEADTPEYIGDVVERPTERTMNLASFTARRELIAQTVGRAAHLGKLDLTPQAYESLDRLDKMDFFPDPDMSEFERHYSSRDPRASGRVLEVLDKSSFYELQAEQQAKTSALEPQKTNEYKPLYSKSSDGASMERER